MLEPKRVKRRRVHRGRFRKVSNRGHQIAFGEFAIKALEAKFITARQIEACRVAINRKMSREGQIWIRIFPDKPRTKKAAETRMGSGKGALDHFVAVVEPGRILFEVSGVSKELAQEALRLAQFKLPIKTKFIVRRDYDGE
ncbi:MAG: LSU ribosomal protein L16 RplP [Bacteroidetes bacterium HLUCCA01]|nr:MAG: LSU ribosomal protein L16 RplP [Bacteroidetes bacterium HLUCCA01]